MSRRKRPEAPKLAVVPTIDDRLARAINVIAHVADALGEDLETLSHGQILEMAVAELDGVRADLEDSSGKAVAS